MNTYLTIMVTVLVVTQIIRITQNFISLKRQEQAVNRDIAWLRNVEPTERDFDNQREVFRMLREELKDRHCNCKEDMSQRGDGS